MLIFHLSQSLISVIGNVNRRLFRAGAIGPRSLEGLIESEHRFRRYLDRSSFRQNLG